MTKAMPGNLETIAPLRIFSVHGYQCEHPMETVQDDRYFLPVMDRLRENDIIIVCAETGVEGNTPVWGVFTVTRRVRENGEETAKVVLRNLLANLTRSESEMSIEHKGSGKYSVLDAEGKERFRSLSKSVAEAIARKKAA